MAIRSRGSWSDPVGQNGAELLPWVHMISWLGMTPGNIDASVYAVRGPQGCILIDCGTPWGFEQMWRNAVEWGISIDDVSSVFLTHGHVDHARGGYLYKQHGVEILAHPVAARATEAEWALSDGYHGDVDEHVDYRLKDGETIERVGLSIEAFHTPGHTSGCMSFLIKANGTSVLFTGDLIMGNGLPGFRGDPGYSAESIAASIGRLQKFSFDHMAYGHGYLMNDRGTLFKDALNAYRDGAWNDAE